MTVPLVLIHGYSDSAKGLQRWRDLLIAHRQLDPARVHLINYQTLTNEVTIRDLAEGLDRALTQEAGIGELEEFDAVVHSTGMLVIRAWLTRYAPMSLRDLERTRRLRHLVAIAPATNGSPVAHKGRSWLGALFKGNKKDFLGPDFLESGHQILRALELGSPFTWDLGEKDMFGDGDNKRFESGPSTPFVFTICGDPGLNLLSDLATKSLGVKTGGSDGVVRWAGAPLNSRRLIIDYTREVISGGTDSISSRALIKVSSWSNQRNQLILWPGHDHGTILRPKDDDPLIELVADAFNVSSDSQFEQWNARASRLADAARVSHKKPEKWQQFIIRVLDERGDSVEDWTISLKKKLKGAKDGQYVDIDDLHPYEMNKSYRCLHINLTESNLADSSGVAEIDSFVMELSMNADSQYVLYSMGQSDHSSPSGDSMFGISEFKVELIDHLMPGAGSFNLLMAYSTTFIDFRVNRQLRLDQDGRAQLCHLQR